VEAEATDNGKHSIARGATSECKKSCWRKEPERFILLDNVESGWRRETQKKRVAGNKNNFINYLRYNAKGFRKDPLAFLC
jgi:hypothetical protein